MNLRKYFRQLATITLIGTTISFYPNLNSYGRDIRKIYLHSKNNFELAQINLPSKLGETVPEAKDIIESIDLEQLGEFNLEDRKYWEQLCSLLAKQSRYDVAMAACSEAIERNSDPDEQFLWMLQSRALFEAGKYLEATVSYSRTLEFSDKNSLALSYRCASYFHLGQYQKAIADCQEALSINGDWGKESPEVAWYFMGLSHSRLNRLNAALNAYHKAIAHTPDANRVLAERCRLSQEINTLESKTTLCSPNTALAFYERALVENNNDVTVWTNQGLYLESIDNKPKALIAYNEALELKPQSSFILVHRCQILNQLSSYQEALSSCQQALEGDRVFIDSTLPEVLNESSLAAIGLKGYETALSYAEKAIALEPKYVKAWNNKAVSLWHLQKYPEAKIAIEETIRIDPNYTQGLFNYGRILSSLKNYSDAVKAYNMALEEDRANINNEMHEDILINKSVALWNLNRCQEALNSTDQLLNMNPDSLAGWYNRGIVLYCLNNYQQALSAYKKANEIAPQNPYVLVGIGRALAKLNQYEDALFVLEEALEIEPDLVLAQQTKEQVINQINRSNNL